MDADGSGELDYEEFSVFLERLRVRPEIEHVFDELAGNKGYFTPEEFVQFVRKVQRVSW